MNTQESILKTIEDKREQYIHAALDIWDYAEPIFEEYKSSTRLSALLEQEGFSVTKGVAGLPTAFIASWGEGKPVIGFMGEFDALPNLSQKADSIEREPIIEGGHGHGCGHHTLGTAAVAAAIAVKDHLKETGIKGTVRFYGCPAEEGGAGKVLMKQAGVFDDCAAAISWHPTDDNGIWSINFHAQQKVIYSFKGKRAADALQIFLMGATNVRHYLDPCFVVRSTILSPGDDANDGEVPEARILYAYRAHVSSQVKEGFQLLHMAAYGAAVMTGCVLTADYKTGTTELLPNRTLERTMYKKYQIVGTVPMTEADWKYAEHMHQALPENGEQATFDLMRLLYEEQAEDIIRQVKGKPYNDVLYPFREINVHKPGSTDICDVSFATPTVQCVAACYIKDTLGHSWQEVAQGRSDICMKGMLVAAKVMALTGAELFEQPLLLEQVRKEFEEKRKAYSYLPLLARKTVENGEMSAQKMDMESKLSDFIKSRKVQVEFTGLCDDGLAQRQTGKALSKNGNALEALEFFTLGLAYGNKDIFDKVGYETRIMETGDEDMVKVPELTKILVTVKQQEDIRSDDLREFFTGVDMVATGAAEVTGCQVKFLFE